ncbi:MAG: D-aminoacyl-tRNA deacylase [Flavobacteriales bacterium]
MRTVLQRTSNASVSIGGKTVGQIERGFLVLAGFEEADTAEDLEWMAAKILALRVFPDEEGKMNRSVQDIDGRLLVVSQFTLHAKTKKGTRPSFVRAAPPQKAIPLYEHFVRVLERLSGTTVETGEFGADMQVSLTNDGPVTIMLDTKNKE